MVRAAGVGRPLDNLASGGGGGGATRRVGSAHRSDGTETERALESNFKITFVSLRFISASPLLVSKAFLPNPLHLVLVLLLPELQLCCRRRQHGRQRPATEAPVRATIGRRQLNGV